MKTALRKDQAGRPRVRSKSVPKSATARSRKRSPIDTALKLYAEFTRNKASNKARTLTGMNKSRVNTEVKGYKVPRSSNPKPLPHEQLTQLDRLARLSQQGQLTPHIQRKVSICPIKRSDASIEMNIHIGKSSVSTLRPPRAQRLKMVTVVANVATVATPATPVQRRPVQEVEQQKAETHRIPGTDLTVTMTGKNLVTDIVRVFRRLNVDKMAVDSLLHYLCTDSTKPWTTFVKGEPMKARQLNTVLTKEFGIHSYDIRIGSCGRKNGRNTGNRNTGKVVKGLHRKVFELLQALFVKAQK